jgi:UDP-N-acetylmuramoyl-tripeptide--D-alanyl-D-alanine ligase
MEVTVIGGARVINDAYNANPASMAAALTALTSIKDGRRVAVLGDMLELGSSAPRAHFDVGRLAGAGGLSLLVLVGPHANEVKKGAVESGMAEEDIMVAPSPEGAASVLAERMRKGDNVLVKGSRGMRMERVIELLKAGRLVA